MKNQAASRSRAVAMKVVTTPVEIEEDWLKRAPEEWKRIGPQSRWELITPDLAPRYLETMAINRPVVQSQVAKFARDMTNDEWRRTHQGIGFDWDGHLMDGQHRLWAAIESGASVWMLVTYGLDPDSNVGVDNGKNRTVSDILHYRKKKAGKLESGIAKWMIIADVAQPTRTEIVESYERHEEAITAVVGLFPARQARLVQSATLAPPTRAWYQPSYREQLERFATVLISGRAGDSEEPIILLREFLIFLKSTGGGNISKEIYAKTERALYAFLHGQRLAKLYAANKELFPLPTRGTKG